MKIVFQQLSIGSDSSFVVKTYCQPAFTAPIHFHYAFEIICIVNSYGKLYCGNEVINYGAGDVYLFGPGLAHCFYNDPQFTRTGEMARAIVVQFSKDFLGSHFFNAPEMKKVRSLLDKASSGTKFLVKESSRKLFHTLDHKKPLPNLIQLLQLLQELSEIRHPRVQSLGSRNIPSAHMDDPGKIEVVVQYIMENFTSAISISKAASLACLNKSAFCRYFKRRTGRTFSEFVNEVRITHACKMLQEGDESISSICFESGFDNLSYFNRQFKRVKKLRPGQYRKILKEQYGH